MIAALLTWAWPYIAGAGVALAALAAIVTKSRSAGRKAERTAAKDADYETADDLRRHVDRNLDDRVRQMEGRGYRD